PEQAGSRIEVEAERIAQAVRKDEVCRAAVPEERIPGSGAAVEGEAQDLSVQATQVLGVRIRRLTGAAAVAEARVAHADIEQAVGAGEAPAAGVVAVVGPDAVAKHGQAAGIDAITGNRHADDPVLPPRSRALRAARRITAGRQGVVEIEEAVARELRI